MFLEVLLETVARTLRHILRVALETSDDASAHVHTASRELLVVRDRLEAVVGRTAGAFAGEHDRVFETCPERALRLGQVGGLDRRGAAFTTRGEQHRQKIDAP